jgi:hypothetical protein
VSPTEVRWGEPTGLVPRGPGAKGGSRPLALPLAGANKRADEFADRPPDNT